MAAAVYDIYIEQGATFRLLATWKDGNNAPIDLTSYTARMQVRRTYNSPDPPLLTFTTENGGITLGGTAGTVSVLGLATITDDIPAKPGVYDLELVANDGTVTRLLQGFVTISPEVTK